jgi:hypothetical protein
MRKAAEMILIKPIPAGIRQGYGTEMDSEGSSR